MQLIECAERNSKVIPSDVAQPWPTIDDTRTDMDIGL